MAAHGKVMVRSHKGLDMNSDQTWAARALDRADERFENQIQAATESANIALKALLLLNGGACLALLAFLANVVKDAGHSASAEKLVVALLAALSLFAYGAACAVGASAFGYVANRAYAESGGARTQHASHPYLRKTTKSKAWGVIAAFSNLAGIALACGSIWYFLDGVWLIQPHN